MAAKTLQLKVKRSRNNQWRYKLYGKNGEQMWTSEPVKNRLHAVRMCEKMKRDMASATIDVEE